MWTSDRGRKRPVEEAAADLGQVTLSEEQMGVYLEGERRWTQVYSPGGYHWRPALEEQVLVLKAGSEREEPCILGVEQKEKLEPGEVSISSSEDRAQLRLTNRGELALEGDVTVNGKALRKLIEEIVSEIVGSGGGL